MVDQSNVIYIDDSEPEGVLEPAFPYRDVTIKRNVDANEIFDILGEVGRGKFGTVYKCQEKQTNLKLAAKFVPIPKREDKRNVEREVEIMNSLQHHLIIQLYAAYEYQKMMVVVLELVEGGELFDRVVEEEFVLTERACVVFIRQVCEAMKFIHQNNILHLDLKPENILCLTQEGNRIKIIDFGLARKFDPNKRLQILFGTPEFVAPEVVNFDCISYATDMWSVGVICYVLISGLSPFMGENDIETMANVTIAKYDFEDESFANVSPDCIDFISKLLVKDLSTRMTAAQCLEHKWLQRRPASTPIVSPKAAANMTPMTTAATPVTVNPLTGTGSTPTPSESTNGDEEDVDDIGEDEAVNDTLEDKELDKTKDNIKNFIERWEEHPNSPYVFDGESNVIAPLSDISEKPRRSTGQGHESISSSRGCSPSPCESIDTLTDNDYDDDEGSVFEAHLPAVAATNDSPTSVTTPVNESREKLYPIPGSGSVTPTPQQNFNANNTFDEFHSSSSNLSNVYSQQRSIKSYLHTFDRRNSDTNYLLGRRSSGERVNLADEIRKLSDHLMMLAQINNKLDGEAKKEMSEESATSVAKSGETKKTSSGSVASTSTTSTATKTQRKTATSSSVHQSTQNTYNTNTSTNTASTTTSSSSTATSSTSSKSKAGTLAMRLQQSIEETPKLTNGGVPWKANISSRHVKSTISTITTSNVNNTSTSSTSGSSKHSETATTRRAKFRINQMSRDVPIGLPDTHQTVNLEEAANTTKDCLLHLLEKYNDNKCRNPLGRHQSISVDWNNISDNLEYRSMSSINAFFQRHHNSRQHVKQLQAQLEEKTATSPPSK